jgi:hypothetical protein
MFALLNRRVLPRLGTRFGASIRGTNLLPGALETDLGAAHWRRTLRDGRA